jgi:xylulokinase
VLEGLSLAIRHNLELMAQGQPQGFSLYVGGGGAGSQVWLEVLASVLGRPLLVLKIPETEPLGAAWLAGKGIREVKQCTRGEALIQRTVLPREDLMETYTKLLNIYRELYASNQRLFKNLSGG